MPTAQEKPKLSTYPALPEPYTEEAYRKLVELAPTLPAHNSYLEEPEDLPGLLKENEDGLFMVHFEARLKQFLYMKKEYNKLLRNMNTLNEAKLVKDKVGEAWQPFQFLPASSKVVKDFKLKASEWGCFQNYEILEDKFHTGIMLLRSNDPPTGTWHTIKVKHKSAKEPIHITLRAFDKLRYAHESVNTLYGRSKRAGRPWTLGTNDRWDNIGDLVLERKGSNTQMEGPVFHRVSFIRNNVHCTIWGLENSGFHSILRDLDKKIINCKAVKKAGNK